MITFTFIIAIILLSIGLCKREKKEIFLIASAILIAFSITLKIKQINSNIYKERINNFQNYKTKTIEKNNQYPKLILIFLICCFGSSTIMFLYATQTKNEIRRKNELAAATILALNGLAGLFIICSLNKEGKNDELEKYIRNEFIKEKYSDREIAEKYNLNFKQVEKMKKEMTESNEL